MNLSFEQLTENLLNRFECVILPDFGGFIVRDSPCNFNVSKDKIKPSTKQIFFNPHLTANDGLLYNEIQTLNACTYSEAVDWYQSTISDYKQLIENTGSKKFGNLGTFYKGNENNYWFSPTSDLNLSLDTFGLTAVDVVKVVHQNQEQEIQETKVVKPAKVIELADNKPISTTEPFKLNYKAWIAAATIALLVHFVYLNVEKTDTTTNQASVLPTFQETTKNAIDTLMSTPNDAITDTVSQETFVTETPVTPQVEEVQPTPEVVEPKVTETPKEIEVEQAEINSTETTPVTPEKQYERVARYKIEDNALAHKKDLEKKGKICKVEYINNMFEVLIEQ